jgi:hypothetical protein
MKKYTFFITLLILALASVSYAAFNNSMRSVNSSDLVQDDWDSIIRPMYIDGLKGKSVVIGMDNVWGGSALYMGAGLDLFGMKQSIAVQYDDSSSDQLDDVNTTAYSRGGTVYTQTIVSSSDETVDTAETGQTTTLNLYIGWGLGLGSMDVGIGVLIGSVNSDTEVDETSTQNSTITNGITQTYGQERVTKNLGIDSDSTLGIVLGVVAGSIRGQLTFSILGLKGDGSMNDDTRTDKYWLGRLQRIQTDVEVGDYDQVVAAIAGNNEYDLDSAATGPISLSGSEINVDVEMAMSDMVTPGLGFRTRSMDIDDDEKVISNEVTDTTYYNNVNNRANTIDITTTTYTYDISALSEMEIGVYNKSKINVSENVLLKAALGFNLETSKKEFSITKSETVINKDDTNDDGVLEVNNSLTRSGQVNNYLRETSEITIILPIYVELTVAKGVALRVGSRLGYTVNSTDTTTTKLSAHTTQDFTDAITPANSYAARKQNYTETKTVDEDTSTTVTKQLQFGAGWDINEKIAVDMLTVLTPGNGVIDISAWYISATSRF